jgi:AsmA-like protein
MRRRRRWIIRSLSLALVAGLVWGGWYVYNKGFSRTWREYVMSEFRKRGVQISFRRLSLDPFQGLVARDVKIIDPKDEDKLLAVINQIVLDINYGDLLHGQPFLNAVDLRDADLALPLDPSNPNGERVQVSRLNARLVMPPHQLYLAKAEAEIYGIHVSATGRLINPEAYRPSAPTPEAESKKRADVLGIVVGELKKLRFESAPPALEIRFSGDLAEPEKIFAEATLSGENIRRGAYRLANLSAAVNYRDRAVTLKQLVLSDSHGSLDACGSYQGATGQGDFHLRSDLDAQGLIRSAGLTPMLDEFVFYSTPVIELSGEIDRAGALKTKLLGRVSLQKFAMRSSVFESFGADFSWDGDHWFVSGAHLANRTGELLGSALQAPGNFRLKLHSTINPASLLPLFSGPSAELLADWEFEQSPEIEFSVAGPSPDLGACEGEGRIKLGRARLRGVPLNTATCAIRLKDKAVTCDQINIERDEGRGSGSFTYDFGKHEVRIDHVRMTMAPGDVAKWINADLVERVAPYHFKKPPYLSINGVVQFDGGKNTNLEMIVDAGQGMDYVFMKKTLPFSKISGRLLFTDERLRISGLAGTLFSGQLRGGADISFSKTSPGYSATISAENVDFEKLTGLYFGYKESKGLLNGEYHFIGLGAEPRMMRGQGAASVTNGNVFAIPFLGPLSALLSDLVPGIGYDVAHKASARFDVGDGVIHTQDFVASGAGFSMIGGGDLYFLDDKMNFHIRMNAQGIPGVVLFPVSKLLEYVSDGSLSKPVWRPKVLPRVNGESRRP